MELQPKVEKIHLNLAGKRVLFVDQSSLTTGLVHFMKTMEKLDVTQLDNLIGITDLADFMEQNRLNFAIIHNATLEEANVITDAFQKGKMIVVQEKNSDLELNRKFNKVMKTAGIKTFPRAEPDHLTAFKKCLDYLSAFTRGKIK